MKLGFVLKLKKISLLLRKEKELTILVFLKIVSWLF